MSQRTIDALAQLAGAVSRRHSLLTLGGASLSALAGPSMTEASKSGKKAKKKAKKIKKKKCKKQVGQCSTFLAGACLGDPVCESAITCCGLFANCNAAAALPCIFTN